MPTPLTSRPTPFTVFSDGLLVFNAFDTRAKAHAVSLNISTY